MRSSLILLAILLMVIAVVTPASAAEPLDKQVQELKAAMPKFGIPMREVGERFQNMYFAARAENWALASYMSKSMNAAMSPVKVSQAYLYPFWEYFYGNYFKPVTMAIRLQDSAAFEREFAVVIEKCNSCHYEMGFAFVKVKKPEAPATQLLDFNVRSRPEAFRE